MDQHFSFNFTPNLPKNSKQPSLYLQPVFDSRDDMRSKSHVPERQEPLLCLVYIRRTGHELCWTDQTLSVYMLLECVVHVTPD